MKIEETKLKGCFVIEPEIFHDERGHFFESFNQKEFEKKIGQKVDFVQDNQSFSKKGVLRGIHFQMGKYAQAKLVRVLSGKVLDVAVDLRKDSKTFGEYIAVELSAENKKQMFVPRGFGHGFITLSETSEFAYKCDNFYQKESERGIIYNDKSIKIDWQLAESEIIVSQKDNQLPSFDVAILELN
ncbi:dTDP-4-dehydrorhamnose 3,5-epimerase [Galbibacter pacificus]|uniref:dTDP-4-dehydrorhamnose 3,5-epimerase n=1 Tax=Galbibacter pacificus TaxID=2996052 RepID=A0ABT6FND0_9FLAO|nr:dTDP-4-dehydrorhamnose 3,5-epimerase [Galbibacter pacificus]MDG3581290.1 dTDP-4-dehydrorhamnose 3,5-epimerase [Galbibacter pacificus]MDG3584768.1 dTDP-4-dehydrorhamnose 3,5-epimerase [Galbibacter pacificus]